MHKVGQSASPIDAHMHACSSVAAIYMLLLMALKILQTRFDVDDNGLPKGTLHNS